MFCTCAKQYFASVCRACKFFYPNFIQKYDALIGVFTFRAATVDFWQAKTPLWCILYRHTVTSSTIFYSSKSSQGPSLGCLASHGCPALTLDEITLCYMTDVQKMEFILPSIKHQIEFRDLFKNFCYSRLLIRSITKLGQKLD